MQKNDDYFSGPHQYWLHFICGFVFGACVGASLIGWLFDSRIVTFVGAAITGLCFGILLREVGRESLEVYL